LPSLQRVPVSGHPIAAPQKSQVIDPPMWGGAMRCQTFSAAAEVCQKQEPIMGLVSSALALREKAFAPCDYFAE
jgi:hypothetical protein